MCIRFTSSVEGIRGDQLSITELRDLIRMEPATRHQVVGVQILVGAKFGYRKKPSQKTILYKTEYQRESSLGHNFKHTKEYDVQDLGKQGAGDMNSPSVAVSAPQPLSTDLTFADASKADGPMASTLGATAIIGEEQVSTSKVDESEAAVARRWVAPWRAKRQVVQSQALNRPHLSEMTARCVRYIEKARGVVLQSLRGHFVQDSTNTLWMVGASKVMPVEDDFDGEESSNASVTYEIDPTAARLTKSIHRLQEAAEACLEAAKQPPQDRKESAHQVIFAELRGNHFLDQLCVGWQIEIAKTAEYRFVECGLEVYYNGDVLDEFYVIIQGSVRMILEPTNTVYCRTIDLSDKDTFAQQAITEPGSRISSQAVALEDTHLMVIKRRSVEAVINRGRPLSHTRWHITKRQLTACRRIFGWDVAVRNVLDLKQAMESTVNCRFFQNLSTFLHMDLCSKTTYRSVPPGSCCFEDALAGAGRPIAYFVIVIRGSLRWSYYDDRLGEQVTEVSAGQYLLAVGTAVNNTSDDVEVLILLRQHWEHCTSNHCGSDAGSELKTVQHSKAPSTSFFLTEVDASTYSHHPVFGTEASDRSDVGPGGGLLSPLAAAVSRFKTKPANKQPRSRSLSFAAESPAAESPLEADSRRSTFVPRSKTGSVVGAIDIGLHAPVAEDKGEHVDVGGRVAVSFDEMSKEQQLAVQREKHLTCAVTGSRFPAAQQRTLMRRQVQDTALHLQKRCAQKWSQPYKGFVREKWLIAPKGRLALFDRVIVSQEAYNVFITEQNLQDQEKLFAKSLMNMSVPRMCERSLPPSGSTQMTTQLLFAGMFVEFVRLESPSALLAFGSELEVRFRLCEQDVSARIDLLDEEIPPGGAPMDVDQVRMSWFFCSNDGVNAYLKAQSAMEFGIYNCQTRAQVASIEVDLSDLANKVALQQSFRMPVKPVHKDLASVLALEFVYLHLNIGCIKFREVDATDFRLRRRQGLYIPSSPFITECLPPDGWDPCNEEYIKLLANGLVLEQDKAALTMDGVLIPRNKHVTHLIRIQPSGADADSPQSHTASKRKFIRLSDGIAPAPIWQRKNYGELPPKYGCARPISAPLKSSNARGLLSRPGSANLDSPATNRASGRRRPVSSPAKRTASSRGSSRPASPSAKSIASPKTAPSRAVPRSKRPESAPPCADAGGGAAAFAQKQTAAAAKMRPISAQVRRPSSAMAQQGRPLSAKVPMRQRPNSALGYCEAPRSRQASSTSSRSPMRPRPNSAMSNIASSADEYDLIETIDELDAVVGDGEKRGRMISPFDADGLDEELSDNFALSRASSSISAITGNFGGSYRRPASALAANGYAEETEETNSKVLAAITRPRSAQCAAGGSTGAKCVQGLRNRVPSFHAACAVSKLTGVVPARMHARERAPAHTHIHTKCGFHVYRHHTAQY